MRLGQRAPYIGYRSASFVANALPAGVAVVMARVLGVVMSVAMRGRRRMIGRHLRRVYGQRAGRWRVALGVQAAFDSYARYWLESFRLATTTPAALDASMSYEGLDIIEAALANGKGVIAALPHLGGWDFGGAWLTSQGYPLTVVVEDLQPPELFEWFARLRAGLGLTIVRHGREAGGAVARALRANQVVCLLSDRDLTRDGVEVEFFGERTTLPAGPATLALRTGAALVPMALYYDRHGHYGVVRPPIPTTREGSVRADVGRITQLLASELETLIRRAPEQWHLFQPNWPSDFESLRT